MKQYVVLIIAVLIGLVLWGGANIILQHRRIEPLSFQPVIKSRIYLPGADFEEELIFFLARHMGIYEGEFEVIDVVDLEMRNISGVDYILVTFRAPNGNLCQVTIAKDVFPWAQWEIIPESFSVVELPEARIRFTMDTPQWMQALGITPEQVAEYLAEHPDMKIRGESAFLNKKTQRYALPVDWSKSVRKVKPLRFSINKNKQIGLSSLMLRKSQIGLLNSYWQPDYPTDYSGPGYRAYLYGKSKGE